MSPLPPTLGCVDLTIVGCSGSFAGPASPASCYLVRATHEGRTWAVTLDLGNGALGALQRHLDPCTLDAAFVSHLHVDHCIDLCGLYVMRRYSPTGMPQRRLPVHAPAGALEHLANAYGNRAHESLPESFDLTDLLDRQPIVVGPFTVTPFAVLHPVPAFGFRVQAGGRTLVYTGDTDDCPALEPLMAGADLVLADAAFIEQRDRLRGIHLTGRRAAQAAVRAGGVGRLMLTHLPPWNDPQVCRAEAQEVWPGEVELAAPDVTYAV